MDGLRFDDGLRRSLGVVDLIGVDEAGRGPLAGPVVVAAVLLKPKHAEKVKRARDSKLLTPEQRETIFESIRVSGARVAVSWAHPRRIERENILRATLGCMRRAAERVVTPRCWVLVDGNVAVPELSRPQLPVIDGDRYSLAVSCASVVAKVLRDRWLRRLDRLYPGYGLAQHKGYSTPEHFEALRRLGPSPVHRMTFAPVVLAPVAE